MNFSGLPREGMREKRTCLTIYLEKTSEGHRQSDEHWNCLKDSTGETSQMGGGGGLSPASPTHFTNVAQPLILVMRLLWNWLFEQLTCPRRCQVKLLNHSVRCNSQNGTRQVTVDMHYNLQYTVRYTF